MANRDNPRGFLPIKHLGGGDIRYTEVPLEAANAILGIGDPLMKTANGLYNRWAAGNPIAGIAMEAKAANAGAGATVLAIVDKNVIFVGQTDDTTGTLTAQTGVGLNATIIVGNAVNGRSICEIDESSGAAGATLPLKVLALHPVVGNEFGQFNVLQVLMNEHTEFAGTTGI